MEILHKEVFFSKQGKASMHSNAMLFQGTKKRPKAKELNIVDPSDAKQMKNIMDQQKIEESNREKPKAQKLSPAFTVVSRSQYENAFRNRTESPIVGLYTPNYTAIDPRVNQGPKFVKKKQKIREKVLLFPTCVDSEMRCTFPKNTRPQSNCRTADLQRTTFTYREYAERLYSRTVETPVLTHQVKPLVDFRVQTPREPFVRAESPPHEKRFTHIHPESCVLSSNKRAQTVSFNKMLPRKELIVPKESYGPYNAKDEFIRPKLTTDILEFRSMQGRTPNVNKQYLMTPQSPDLDVYDKAFNKQSSIRG